MFSVIKKLFLWIDLQRLGREKSIVLSIKSLKYHIAKTLLLSSICNKCGSEDEKIFMEEESIEILKILCLITNIEEYQKIIIMSVENIVKNLDWKIKQEII